MKRTKSILAFLMLAVVIWSQNAMPVNAATPTYDITGVWKIGADTFQVFQEKDEINGIYVNGGFAHRWSGRYVSPTKIKAIQIRRTRPNNCEVTMEMEITVNSANSMTVTSFASETACGISVGPFPPGTLTRSL